MGCSLPAYHAAGTPTKTGKALQASSLGVSGSRLPSEKHTLGRSGTEGAPPRQGGQAARGGSSREAVPGPGCQISVLGQRRDGCRTRVEGLRNPSGIKGGNLIVLSGSCVCKDTCHVLPWWWKTVIFRFLRHPLLDKKPFAFPFKQVTMQGMSY